MRPSPDSPLGRLLNGPMQPGRLVWIGLRPARKADVVEVDAAQLHAGRGIEGDHYDTRRDGPRQVTLIGAENLQAIASFLGQPDVAPATLRRNLVTRGINLQALKSRRFCIGETVLEATGDCAPCGQMELALGPGGYNAVRSNGGITARILTGGRVRLADAVVRLDA